MMKMILILLFILESLAWNVEFEKRESLKGYLRYKTIFCSKVALNV